MSYQQYWDLALNHECEECEQGMLFYNYVEKVEYFDPEPPGDVIKTALYTCPNHSKAIIVIEEEKINEVTKKEVECNICRKGFSSLQNLEFHKRRTHS